MRRIVTGEFQRFEVVRGPGALQPGMLGHAAQAFLQAVDAAEIEVVVAPLQNLDGLEVVIFELVDEFLVEGLDVARDAERAVVEMAAGAARDLGKLRGREAAVAAPVEFAGAGEGDVVDIEIEAHADGIGGDEEIDIARLIERNLRIAGARAQARQARPPRRRAACGSARRWRKRRSRRRRRWPSGIAAA